MSAIELAARSIRDGGLAVVPTDTVYGLVCSPYSEHPVRALAALKGRPPGQPTALMSASIEELLECIPELRGRSAVLARALLPGPYTLVLPNPARRFPWLTGPLREIIGVRVPELAGPGNDVLERVGAVAASSANVHGGADPCRLEDVAVAIRNACVTVDGGELPGTPSTVLDLTGPQPRVLREGAVPEAEALGRVAAALAQ